MGLGANLPRIWRGRATTSTWITRRPTPGYKTALPMRESGVLLPLFSIRSPSRLGAGRDPRPRPLRALGGVGGLLARPGAPGERGGPRAEQPVLGHLRLRHRPDLPGPRRLRGLPGRRRRGRALRGGPARSSPTLRASPAVRWHEVRALKERACEIAFRSFLEREWHASTRPGHGAAGVPARARLLARRLRPLRLAARRRAGRQELDGMAGAPAPAATPRRSPRRATSLSERILYRSWLQWQLDEQWHEARRARGRGRAPTSWATCPSWWPPTRPTSGPDPSTSASTPAPASRPTPSAPTARTGDSRSTAGT